MRRLLPSRLARAAGLLAGLAALASPGLASTLELYGPASIYVTKDVSFRRLAQTAGAGPHVSRLPFSDTAPLSPSVAYSGPVFYGGYEFISAAIRTGVTRQQIRNDRMFGKTPHDTITLQAFREGGWGGSALALRGVYVFKQELFSPGFSAEKIQGLSLSWSGSGNAAPGGPAFALAGRFVVQKAGAYHVSSVSFPLAAHDGAHSLSGAALELVQWAPYDPAANLDFDASRAAFGPLDLRGVAAVGVYFENDAWNGSDAANAAFTFELRGFNISTATP
jgi:hypothetical protein